MALKQTRRVGRAAFTLVELLVVIGIMAVLATISVVGYNAATRGMADRGVVQTTLSILRIAQQTCEIDRVPTKVFFFNRLLSNGSDEDSPTLYQGTAIAIKQAGRISISPDDTGGVLVDEFADWHQSYPMKRSTASSKAPGMRIYRMTWSDKGSDIEACSMMVEPSVSPCRLDDYMIQSDTRINLWCQAHRRTAQDNSPNGEVPNGNDYVWGFKGVSGSGGGATDWRAGDPYGIEIARIDLPKGYIFGRTAPHNVDKLLSAQSVFFNPGTGLRPEASDNVQISAMRPVKGGRYDAVLVGTVTKNMLHDEKDENH